MLIARRFGGAFDFASVAGLIQDTHVTASKVTLVAGDKISALTATVGANHTQATDAKRLVYSATAVNGRPGGVSSDGTKYLTRSISQATGDWTMFYVVDVTSHFGGTQILADWETGRIVPCAVVTSAGNNPGFYVDSGAGFRDCGGAGALGAQILTFRFTSGTITSATIRRNGVVVGSGMDYGGGGTRALGGQSALGADYAGGSGLFGAIGRELVYTGAKSLADVQAIERGLGALYGIVVP